MVNGGVDINGLKRCGNTGLFLAMNSASTTVLHYACQRNQVEFEELLLSHETCTKDIVTMKDVNPTTPGGG